MEKTRVEERLAILERQVADLLAAKNGAPAKDWRSTIGMFTGDEVMKQIDETAGAMRASTFYFFLSPSEPGTKLPNSSLRLRLTACEAPLLRLLVSCSSSDMPGWS